MAARFALASLFLTMSICLAAAAGGKLRVFPADGYSPSQYSDILSSIAIEKLKLALPTELAGTTSVCIAHSTRGRDAAVADRSCNALVLFGKLSPIPIRKEIQGPSHGLQATVTATRTVCGSLGCCSRQAGAAPTPQIHPQSQSWRCLERGPCSEKGQLSSPTNVTLCLLRLHVALHAQALSSLACSLKQRFSAKGPL